MTLLVRTLASLSVLGVVCLALLPPDDSDSFGNDAIPKPKSVNNNCTCGRFNKQDEEVNVGGRMVETNKYPLMVGLVRLDKKIVFCGSTVITESHILTSAYCLYGFKPEEVGIYVGHAKYEGDTQNSLLEPEKFLSHEKFEYGTIKYDIAIIFMKESMSFLDRIIGPACMLTKKISLEGKSVTVLGWSSTDDASLTAVILRDNLDVLPLEYCQLDHQNVVVDIKDRHQICTYRKSKKHCNLNTGGPLLYLDPATQTYSLVGITSYGYNCDEFSAVGTDVAYFLPWITNAIYETEGNYKTCAKTAKRQ